MKNSSKNIKKQEILNGDWDNLIILDACRYDYFKKLYSEYLKGKLEKRESRGGCTTEWLCKTFKNYMDIVYFSTNPFINNKNMSLRETVPKASYKFFTEKELHWNPTKKFQRVVDVWERAWDEKWETVLPWDLVDKVVESNFNSERKIIHFVQPHTPYLSYKKNQRSMQANKERVENQTPNKDTDIRRKLLNKIKPFIGPFMSIFSKRIQWKIKDFAGMELSVIQRLAVEGKTEKIKKLYKENLEIALRETAKLIKILDGKTVITTDHGESLGENGYWGHKANANSPVLRIVPWFEVENVKDDLPNRSLDVDSLQSKENKNSSEKEIKKKLEALGYKT